MSCVVSSYLSDRKINNVKKKYSSADFYTVADDAAFYVSKGLDYLEKNKVDVVQMQRESIICFDDKYYIKSDTLRAWDVIFYSRGKAPLIVKPIDIADEFGEYFVTGDFQEVNYSNLDTIINQQKRNGYSLLDAKDCDINRDKLTDKILVFKPDQDYKNEEIEVLDSPLVILLNHGGDKYQSLKNKNVIYTPTPIIGIHGLEDIVIKNNFFTIEQSMGNGNLKSMQYITFKYDVGAKNIVLYKFSEADNLGKITRAFSQKEFGNLPFEKVTQAIFSQLK